jgi:hypothetical protein
MYNAPHSGPGQVRQTRNIANYIIFMHVLNYIVSTVTQDTIQMQTELLTAFSRFTFFFFLARFISFMI